MLTRFELDLMERDGFVTIDTPFDSRDVTAAAGAADRLFDPAPEGFTGEVTAPEILRLIQHPFVEAAAEQMLRCEDVFLWGVALRKTRPRPDATPRLEGEHADIRFSAADLDATPRRVLCTALIWLTDVTPTRAPMMYRPGSHRQLAEAYDGPPSTAAFALDRLPRLPYAEPVPILARAGQISVGTTGVIHSGSVNTDTRPRKVVFLQFQARGTPRIEGDAKVEADTRRYFERVAPLFDASRLRLLPL